MPRRRTSQATDDYGLADILEPQPKKQLKPTGPGGGLPAEVPLLAPEDVCVPWRTVAEKLPLAGWFEATFPLADYSARLRDNVYATLLQSCQHNLGYHGLQPPEALPGDLAAAWNLAMRALGYEVPEYLCILTRRLKREKSAKGRTDD